MVSHIHDRCHLCIQQTSWYYSPHMNLFLLTQSHCFSSVRPRWVCIVSHSASDTFTVTIGTKWPLCSLLEATWLPSDQREEAWIPESQHGQRTLACLGDINELLPAVWSLRFSCCHAQHSTCPSFAWYQLIGYFSGKWCVNGKILKRQVK